MGAWKGSNLRGTALALHFFTTHDASVQIACLRIAAPPYSSGGDPKGSYDRPTDAA